MAQIYAYNAPKYVWRPGSALPDPLAAIREPTFKGRGEGEGGEGRGPSSKGDGREGKEERGDGKEGEGNYE